MMTTNITNPNRPEDYLVLKTASDLGITYYRMGWLSYDDKKEIAENIKDFKDGFKKS